MNSQYLIKPQPYKPPTIAQLTDEDRQFGKSFCSISPSDDSWFPIAWLAAVVVLGFGWYHIGFQFSAICAAVVFFSVPFTIEQVEKRTLINKHSRERVQREKESIQQQQASVIAEAESLTSINNLIYDDSHDAPRQLTTLLNQAEADLDAAQRDFKDGAFAPFWDAIESAAKTLSSFAGTVDYLGYNAAEYYNSLHGRDHTFPVLPIALKTLPDPTRAAKRMQSLVRQAQCNFQFATIYEQRKTNNILKEGFMSLGSAIAELDSKLQGSFAELRGSLSKGFASVVQQQIATRDSIEAVAAASEASSAALLDETQRGNEESAEMLDNIQRRRIPHPRKPSDGAY